MHYIEDRFSHAKIHNEILRAKNIVIMGNTLDSVQIAQATRDYLDQVGFFETKVTLMSTGEPEVRKTLGDGIEKVFRKHLKRQRISYLPNCHITNLQGDNELQGIYFHKEGDFGKEKVPDTEYFV